MKHPLPIAILSVVGIIGIFFLGPFAMRTYFVNIPHDWTIPVDDGGGIVDDGDDGTPADNELISESGNMIVTSPTTGEIVGLPLQVRGRARVFENTLNYRVLDDAEIVLAEGYVMTNAEDMGLFGDFVITTSYAAPSGAQGVVEVFDYSAKDGNVIDLVSVPIIFPSFEAMSVKVFFTTSETAEDCSTVVASEHRVARSPAVAHAALSQLLAGPDTSDVSQGYGTSIPQFTLLKSITIEDGVAKAEFTSAIEGGGSCRVTAIRAQIEATLKQFPTVTSVIITTEGRSPEESLQP